MHVNSACRLAMMKMMKMMEKGDAFMNLDFFVGSGLMKKDLQIIVFIPETSH